MEFYCRTTNACTAPCASKGFWFGLRVWGLRYGSLGFKPKFEPQTNPGWVEGWIYLGIHARVDAVGPLNLRTVEALGFKA